MTVEYHINSRDALITVTFKGSVRAAEACVAIDEMLRDSAYAPELPQLVDLREAELAGDAAELKAFETFMLGDYRNRLDACVAIVVNPNWDEPTCAKAFWLSCALQHAELFDNWNQACKWLITNEFDTPFGSESADAMALTEDLDAMIETSDDEAAAVADELSADPEALKPPC